MTALLIQFIIFVAHYTIFRLMETSFPLLFNRLAKIGKHLNATFLILILCSATSCSGPKFRISGNIEDAEGELLLLEKPDHAGIWTAVDSTRLGKSGKFSFSRNAPEAPEIFRLVLGSQFIYFPIYSIEHLQLIATAGNFGSDFVLSGSDQAEALASFERDLHKALPHLQNPDSAETFKRRIFTTYLQNARGSLTSYYILTKTIGDKPLFSEPSDRRYIAAVATAYRNFRPSDPRTPLLENIAKATQRDAFRSEGKVTSIEAPELDYPAITLPDAQGKEISLSTVVGKGAPTLLLFTDLSAPETPALNASLRKLCLDGNLKVYNVGMDADRVAWRQAVASLPFTCVYGGSPAQTSRLALDYQLRQLPAMFLFDAAGNLTARVADLQQLKKILH